MLFERFFRFSEQLIITCQKLTTRVQQQVFVVMQVVLIVYAWLISLIEG